MVKYINSTSLQNNLRIGNTFLIAKLLLTIGMFSTFIFLVKNLADGPQLFFRVLTISKYSLVCKENDQKFSDVFQGC